MGQKPNKGAAVERLKGKFNYPLETDFQTHQRSPTLTMDTEYPLLEGDDDIESLGMGDFPPGKLFLE